MSDKTAFTNMFELSLTTLLNNLLDLLENRVKALDVEADQLDNIETLKISNAIKLAIRACTEETSKRELIRALQRVTIFYTRYYNVLNESLTKCLERRYLMHLKNRIICAMIETQARFDSIAIDGYRDVVGKHNLIKNSINADPSILQKFKKKTMEKK